MRAMHTHTGYTVLCIVAACKMAEACGHVGAGSEIETEHALVDGIDFL